MPSCGINFRATSGFVTDSAGETYCLATDSYPTTRGGFTFGWTAGTQDARDRNSGIDRRLAGMGFFSGEQGQWRFDLPATGSTDIRLALGDDSNDQHAACLITDNGSTLATISDVLVLGSHFVDASGTDRTEAAWPGSNAAFTGTFSTTTCILKIGVVAGGNNYPIAHFDFNQASAANPEQNSDFPNPRGPRFPQDDRGFLNAAEIHLIGKDKFFGAAGQPISFDWPNPRGRQFPVELRTYLDPIDLPLIGKDKFFGVAGQPPTYLPQPNPNGRIFPIDLRTFVSNVEIQLIGKDQFFDSAGEPPTFDWPNPRGPRWLIDNRTFLNPLSLELFGKDVMYGAAGEVPSYDWQNPRGRQFPSDLRSWLVNLVETTLGILVPLPFNLYDWPNPSPYRYPLENRTFLNPLELQLQGKDQMFGAAGQVPTYLFTVPIGPRSNDLKSLQGNLLESTLSIVVLPFNIYDWPNPRGFKYSEQLRTFLNQVSLELIGKDQFFGAPGEPPQITWAVPRGPLTPIQLRTWIQNLVETTLNIQLPLNQDDWPLPLRRTIQQVQQLMNTPANALLYPGTGFSGTPDPGRIVIVAAMNRTAIPSDDRIATHEGETRIVIVPQDHEV